MLRMRNLFNPLQQPSEGLQPDFGPSGSSFPAPNISMPPSPPNFMQPPQVMGEPSYEQEMAQLMASYQPETMARDRLNSLIEGMPQRPENISRLRKLGSLLVGMSQGPEAQEKLTYAPYYRELADWKEQVNPALQAANLERYGNANERSAAYQTAQATVSGRRADIASEAERRRTTKAEADIERDKKKNQIAEYRAMNPDMELVDDVESGNIFLVHPRTGQKINTGLKHGDMSELEKARWRRGDIQERNRVRELDLNNPNAARNWTTTYDYDPATGTATAVSYNEVTGQSRIIPKPPYPPETDGQPSRGVTVPPVGSNIPPRSPFAPQPQGVDPVTAKPGFPPSQDQRSMEIRVAEFRNRFPELSRFVNIDANGQPTVTQPGKFMGYQTGPTTEQYQQILNALYGTGGNSSSSGSSNMGGQFQPPAGAKPGGTWRQLPSGARVYQEP